MTTQPTPIVDVAAGADPLAIPANRIAETWYVWSNGTDDGSWHQVNQGTVDECEAFAADSQNPALFVQLAGVKYLVLRDGKTPASLIEEHRHHNFMSHSTWWCGLCRYDKAEDEAAREAEHAAEIDRLNTNLVDQVGTALIEIGKAQATIAQLVSPAVFDIEYAESADGEDVNDWLKIARRALRAVERIAIAHREMYAKADTTGAGS